MAYTENRENVRVYGDMDTGVWIAPVGSTLPTDLTTDPAEPFEAAGWLSDDGIKLEVDKDIEEYNALQGGSLVRKKVSKVTQKVTFQCLEETATILSLVHSGAAVTKTATGAAFASQDFGSDQARTVERALVIDAVDGEFRERRLMSAADITFMGEINLAHNTEMRVFAFEATLLAGSVATLMTNSPGVLEGATVSP